MSEKSKETKNSNFFHIIAQTYTRYELQGNMLKNNLDAILKINLIFRY